MGLYEAEVSRFHKIQRSIASDYSEGV